VQEITTKEFQIHNCNIIHIYEGPNYIQNCIIELVMSNPKRVLPNEGRIYIISMLIPYAQKVQNRPQQLVTIFPNPQINQEYIKAALSNQPTNKQTIQNTVLLVAWPAKITHIL
jgi:hypothetical protein